MTGTAQAPGKEQEMTAEQATTHACAWSWCGTDSPRSTRTGMWVMSGRRRAQSACIVAPTSTSSTGSRRWRSFRTCICSTLRHGPAARRTPA